MENTENSSDTLQNQKINEQNVHRENPMLQVKTTSMPTKLEFSQEQKKKHNAEKD